MAIRKWRWTLSSIIIPEEKRHRGYGAREGRQRYLEHVEGFVLVHVKRGGADAALLERGRQPLIVHQPAARRVHKERA